MIEEKKYYSKVLFIVQIATVFLFLGRGWQHLFWDAPFRTFLWDENLMSGFVNNWLSMSWEEYVRSPEVDDGIQNLIKGFGIFYLLLAFFAFLIRKVPKILTWLLPLGSVALIFLALLYTKNAFFSVGQFFEYTLQFLTPVFLFILVNQKMELKKLLLIFKIAIALTFTCHGLYAVGYYPQPVLFVQMTMNTFGISETGAKNFLLTVGFLDFVVAVLIFLPKKWSYYALGYCVFWGFLTTFSRLVGNFYPEFWVESLSKWTPESLYRFPHFLIPLAAMVLLKNSLIKGEK